MSKGRLHLRPYNEKSATINHIIIFTNTAMLVTYTAKYTKTNSGYMGQLIEWQKVITEG
ncbi:hypothetical protein [Nostoc sp.]|uniref:hypothetical protein n=1 Tax=Nostoc sp. TaxID=1180 RepID=UPI002FFB63D9